jgi:hypothetical protein
MRMQVVSGKRRGSEIEMGSNRHIFIPEQSDGQLFSDRYIVKANEQGVESLHFDRRFTIAEYQKETA